MKEQAKTNWLESEEAERLREEAREKGLPESYQRMPQILKMHKSKRSIRTCSEDELLETLSNMGGNVTMVANHYEVSRTTIFNWLEKDDNLHMLEEIDESWNDVAEYQLNQKILSGNLEAIKFRLKTKAKKRGWFESTEHNITQVIKVQLESDGTEITTGPGEVDES